MAAVTQRINSYLGGVSKQSDDKKLPGQVRECYNGFTDPTYGLTKRPGFEHIVNIGNGIAYDNGKWFYINRDDDEEYIGVVKGIELNLVDNGTSGATNLTNLSTTTSGSGSNLTVDLTASNGVVTQITINNYGLNYADGDTITVSAATAGTATDVTATYNGGIFIWNVLSGVQATVTYPQGGFNYLVGTKNNFKTITVQDTTIVINDNTTVLTSAANPPATNTSAVLNLELLVADYNYEVTLQGLTAQVIPQSSTTYDDMLSNAGSVNSNHHLRDAIDQLIANRQAVNDPDFAGTWNFTVNKTNLVIERLVSNVPTSFTIEAKGGINNDGLYVFQEQVSNVARLPDESKHDLIVKVINSGSSFDDYFVKFVADNGVSGRGYWEETVSPFASPGLNNSTMPHELVNTGLNTFEFSEINYTARLVGDDITNEHPSFVNNTITAGFFHNNRLGFLSQDNVSMSQAGSFYNFYSASAQTSLDSDPIDISCSSTKPTSLHAVIPTAQGVILFSSDQQFIMFSDTGVLTPALATIRTISNFELDRNVEPADVGTTISFISKTPGYSRVFSMVTRGQQENPQVLDISRVVKEWISPDVDTLVVSPQNSLIALTGQSLNEVFVFSYYSNGQENLMQSWVSWLMPGTVQFLTANSDNMYAVTKQSDQFTISKAVLSQSPEQGIIVNNQGQRVNPCVDLYAVASSVTYDSATKTSKCYLPYNDVPGLSPIIVIRGSTAGGSFVESGFNVTPDRGSDGTGPFFSITGKDLTSVAADVIVGFKYDFDVELPRIYFRTNETNSDFTANLTISRMKFAVGLSGMMSFKLQANGRSEWFDIQPVIEANYYLANDVPLDAENVFILPIHQRTENFRVRMFNNSPFPVAVNAMMWEGKYTPRFYRRV